VYNLFSNRLGIDMVPPGKRNSTIKFCYYSAYNKVEYKRLLRKNNQKSFSLHHILFYIHKI